MDRTTEGRIVKYLSIIAVISAFQLACLLALAAQAKLWEPLARKWLGQ